MAEGPRDGGAERQAPAEGSTAVVPIVPRHVADDTTTVKRSTPPITGEDVPTRTVGKEPQATPRPGHTCPPLEFTPNQPIGRFELIRELARGGMGQVFVARDTRLGRRVAIKFLLRDDPLVVQRFLVEAQATARCTHENIVTIFEVGEHQNLPYMVLEYLEGQTLSALMETRPSARQFVELMVPVARALERAHEHGIVHRDLKPSNIFVTNRGVVKVLDFGVARLFDAPSPLEPREGPGRPAAEESGSPSLTVGAYVGTLPYMSPEQWGADVVDHTSDLWPFGIMFWRALVDGHPVRPTSATALRAALTDLDKALPSIATRDATLPPDLVAIVDRCLAKRKSQRYPSARALREDLEAFLSPGAEAGTEEVCPYRGLASFGEADAKYFFGRSSDIRGALAQLQTWPLLAVVGPSGVGKSSFVQAGLVPALRTWAGAMRVSVLRPGREPLQRLAGVLTEGQAPGEVDPQLATRLAEWPGLFGTMLRKAAANRGERRLVVIDQFEELFTLCEDVARREHFLAALLSAADDSSSPVRVVLSMRADFLDRLASHQQFLSELTRGLFFLSAPDAENLKETIVRPAELAGYSFESPAIVEEMMRATTSRGALPLLSFAATRLWDGRDAKLRQLTLKAYRQMGGVGGAFAQHADQVVAAIPPQSQQVLQAIMTRLVTPEGTRAVCSRHELSSLSPQAGAAEQVLDQLARGRLIVFQTDPDQAVTVELVHEMLITQWPQLQRWLDESQAVRGLLRDLREAARQWHAHGRPDDLVWRGATAQQALGHDERQVLAVSGLEREYLSAVAALARRTRRRRRLAASSIAGALVLVFIGGAVSVVRINAARHEAERQQERAERQQARAEAQAQTAQATTQFMVDLFKVSDPSESLGNRITAREILDKGASRIQAELGDQPEAQATLMDTIGTVYLGLGLDEAAISLLDQAVNKRSALFGQTDALTLAALAHRGQALTLKGRFPEAEADLRQAIAAQRARGPEARAELAGALAALAEVLSRTGRPDEAEPVIREALAIRRELFGPRHVDVAESLDALGINLEEHDQLDQALAPMQEALEIRRALQGPVHPQVSEAIGNLASLYCLLHNWAECERLSREGLAMDRKLYEGPHPNTAVSLNTLAFALENLGQYHEAEVVLRESVEMTRVVSGPSTELAGGLSYLAFLLRRTGPLEPTIAMLRQSLAMFEQTLEPEHPRVAKAAYDLATMLIRKGEYAEAGRLIDRSLRIRRKVKGEGSYDVGQSLGLRAELLLATRKYQEARRTAVEAQQLMAEGNPSDQRWMLAAAMNVEGAALTALHQYPEAEPLLLQSHPQLKQSPVADFFAQSTQRLAALYKAWGKPDKAREYAAPGQ